MSVEKKFELIVDVTFHPFSFIQAQELKVDVVIFPFIYTYNPRESIERIIILKCSSFMK